LPTWKSGDVHPCLCGSGKPCPIRKANLVERSLGNPWTNGVVVFRGHKVNVFVPVRYQRRCLQLKGLCEIYDASLPEPPTPKKRKAPAASPAGGSSSKKNKMGSRSHSASPSASSSSSSY
jgi:hypothetical protein